MVKRTDNYNHVIILMSVIEKYWVVLNQEIRVYLLIRAFTLLIFEHLYLQEAHSYFHAHAHTQICLTLKKLFILPAIFQLSHWCCLAEPCCFFQDWVIDSPDESFTEKKIQIQSIPPTALHFDKCTRSRDINVNMRTWDGSVP